ncbi:MAG TPA: helix-hairpin-helix domain-containing protein [Gemmatimonadaceae bacterium]|nr:helix-hairpin-helix domain-containing protein [Gemmatimonadaceae bacterium]
MPSRRSPISPETMNADVAARLDEAADLLRDQDANPFRVQAYRHAAQTVRSLQESVGDLFHREGLEGLERLPTIGSGIARAIRTMVLSGYFPMLERLRDAGDPARVLETVPGVGRRLAQRLHDELGVETLEQLEVASHDGSLGDLAGFGEKKVRGIQEALAGRLGRRRAAPTTPAGEPGVQELLDVDREYREKAAAGRLRLITPRRFNPQRSAWLPIMHTQRGDRHYTVLFSNTAQAHRLGRTKDWVVLYHDGRDGEQQCTVVTASRGPLRGRRVVRGREAECEGAPALSHRIA